MTPSGPLSHPHDDVGSLGDRPLLVKLALDWAAVWHKDQRRKYEGADVPYMSHVAGVAAILSRHGFSPAVVAAGALHDVLEDCGVSYDALATKFGADVADLVRHVSEEDKSVAWEDRKRLYLERFTHKPWEAQAITLADKIDNLASIAVSAQAHGDDAFPGGSAVPVDPWSMFKRGKEAQIARFRELLVLARQLPGGDKRALVDEYAAVLARVEHL